MANIYPDALLDAQGAIVCTQTGVDLPNYSGAVLAVFKGQPWVLWLSLNPDGTRKWDVITQGSQLVMADIDAFLKTRVTNGGSDITFTK